MFIFGGILELTKELNEMLIYDFKTGKFKIVGTDSAQDDQMASSNIRGREDESPGIKMKK